MFRKYSKIYNLIKRYKKIYIVRHIGPDPDALASQIALKDTIKETFPNKEVYALGASVSKFKYFGKLDKVDEIDYNALAITLDVPDIRRIDGLDITKFKHSIKIDHHPVVDKYATVEVIDINASSTCEMLLELVIRSKLKANKQAAENLFMGIISDSNRFLFDSTSPKTFKLIAKLIKDYDLSISELYAKLYTKPLSDIRLMGYIATNLVVTDNKFAYIKLDEKKIKELGADSASASNMINDFNNISEVLVWMFVTQDEKGELYKVNVRSRGPIINEICSNYNGGGHKFACGAKIADKKDVDKLIEELDKHCKDYKKDINKTMELPKENK